MKYSMARLARELLRDELAELGALMDAVDRNARPPGPDYTQSARTAIRILTKHPRCPLIGEAVAMSPALKELRGNLALSRAIELGMCDLPGAVKKCLCESRAR